MASKSRFFANSSSSESESESESSSGSSDSEVEVKKKPAPKLAPEPEMEIKRVVLSPKDKLWQQFEEFYNNISTAIKDKSWDKVNTVYDEMLKIISKPATTKVITSNGNPPSFIKSLFLIEKYHSLNKEQSKSFNAHSAKGYNALLRKIKKSIQDYEKDIKPYRENSGSIVIEESEEEETSEEGSEESGSEESEEETSESESEESEEESEEDVKKPVKKPAPKPQPTSKFLVASDEEESGESESWPSGSGSESEESDEDGDENTWFVSKATSTSEAKKPVEKVTKPTKLNKQPIESPPLPSSTSPTTPIANVLDSYENLSQAELLEKLKLVVSQRGKMKTDSLKQIEHLEKLHSLIKGDKEIFNVLNHLIAAQYDTANIQLPLTVPIWRSTAQNILKIIDILERNKNFVLALASQDPLLQPGEIVIHGDLLSLFEMLDDEFSKSLQSMNIQNKDYAERLQDEAILLEIAGKIQEYYETKVIPDIKATREPVAKLAERRIEHAYYKYTPENQIIMSKLSPIIYKFGDERLNARTILCNIYFNAINNKFHEARDMMLMSHIQDNPTLMDISTQILFNRSMVQLGLCAFRNGYIQEAQSCVAEFSGLRKDLLAQGLSITPKSAEKELTREVEETTRTIPAHMWIPIDIIETVNLVSGMLIAVPQAASHPFESKHKTCKFYQRHMDSVDRQIFIAPSESSKDIIYAASKALSTGDWVQCVEYITTLKFWALIPQADQVQEKLKRIVQEVSLKTFLFTYSSYFDSMLLSELGERFQLPNAHVHSIVSKMMTNQEISASWEHSTETITFHRAEQTKLQYLALRYSESLVDFVEQNERIYDVKFGTIYRKKSDDINPITGNQNQTRQHQHQYHHHHKSQQTHQQSNQQQQQNYQQSNTQYNQHRKKNVKQGQRQGLYVN